MIEKKPTTFSIILRRDRHRGIWRAVHYGPNGPTHDVDTFYSSAEKPGDVAHAIARRNPDALIGIASEEIGPACVALGPVVWMRKGFETQH